MTTPASHETHYPTWDEFLRDFVLGSGYLFVFVVLVALAGAFETWTP
jgi:hypothetical protein